MSEPYTILIGLEVHVQLATRSKLFCGCRTTFGQPPNTQTCPVCTSSPGALPVMNRDAFRRSLKTALALNCEIPRWTKWDRKQYWYPDLPKGYQISQFDLPLSQNGWLPIGEPGGEIEPKRIGIIRAHLEEDAGKSMHDELAGRADSRIDLNRTGTPLLEIVSEPDIRSPAEAKAYLTELKLLLNYLGVSDCNMQEGSLRVDANVNLLIPTDDGEVATPIVEVKNMNSFRAVERALAYEVDRQYRQWQETHITRGQPGGHKTTRGWDEAAQVTREQRTKEESSDYRYFPDPDLVPVTVSEAELDEIRGELGELPAALRTRLQETFSITPYDADVLVSQGRPLVDYFLDVAQRCGDGKAASNWVQQDVLRSLNEQQTTIERFPVPAAELAELISRVTSGKLPASRGREVLAKMIEQGGGTAEATMQQMGITEVDASELEDLCRELLEANPKIVAQVKEGKDKAVGALIGQAKKRNANVNPAEVKAICLRLIGQM